MKLSFSTLGCPDWHWSDIYATARDLGYDGVEIRGIGREMFAPKMSIFSHENINKTIKTLKDSNLSIPLFTTAAYLSDPSQLPLAEFEILAYSQLAQKLGVKYVRIMGEKTPEPQYETTVDELAEQYAKFCDLAAPYGVTLLIETNGILAKSADMGYGDIPIEEIKHELDNVGFDGFYSYEWVKRWVPELEGSGIAFHSYADFMRSLDE